MKTRLKNQKLEISKLPNGSFARNIGREIQDKFENIWLQFVRVVLWNF